MAIRVIWPSYSDTHVLIWRVVDLAGMANGTLWSGRYTMSGYVYLDGNQVANKKSLVKLGKEFTLELRIPGRLIDRRVITVIANQYVIPFNTRTSTIPTNAVTIVL